MALGQGSVQFECARTLTELSSLPLLFRRAGRGRGCAAPRRQPGDPHEADLRIPGPRGPAPARTLIRAVLATLLGAFLAAALVTPAVYALLDAAMDEVPWPFSRVFNRVLLLSVLALLFALRRPLELRRARVALSTAGDSRRLASLGAGAAWSLGLAALALALALALGDLTHSERPPGELLFKWVRNVPGALAVSLLEEVFFRLLLFEGLRRQTSWPVAAALSSALYSVLHLLSPPRSHEIVHLDAWSGLRYLEALGQQTLDPALLPGLVGLWLVGFALCVSLHRRGSLPRCIGLHAGWFLAAKLAVYATVLPEGSDSELPVRFLALGLPWTWLSVAIIAALEWRGRAPTRQPSASAAT